MKRINLQKAKAQIARPNTIRDINKQIVLNYVREHAPISRAEIARQTALQRSTVSAIVESLKDSTMIEEIGMGDSTGGRKPTLLRLRTGKPVAIGVDIAPRETTVATADLTGKILDRVSFPTSPDADFMSEQIIERIETLMRKYSGVQLEVGMSLPGIVDQSSSRVIFIPYFKWKDWDIAQQIASRTGLRVTMDNDADAIALAELWFGKPEFRKTRNFITVLVGEGIGTGIIFDGQVYRGENGAAGEFGHMIVGERAPVPCSCGSRDCWEAHASENAAIARYQTLFADRLAQSAALTMNQIVSLAVNGEPHARQVLKETARYLGIGISNLIVGLSPQAIVVSGNITKAWDLIAEDLNRMVERSVRRDLPKTKLMASSLKENPTLMGAFSLVLARKFASAN